MRSMRMGLARGIVALEEEALRVQELAGEETPAVIEDEVEDNGDTLETKLIDISDDEGDCEDVEDDVDEGLDTVEALEELRLAVKAAGANGGLNRDAANIARISLEHLYGRVGHKAKTVVPSLESFGGISDRVRSTLALEADIKQNVSKIWEHIVAAVKKAIEFVQGLFNKFLNGAQYLEDRAKKLAEQASKVEGDLKEKEVDNERLASALHIGGVVPANAEGAKRLDAEYETIYREYPKLLEAIKASATAAEKDADGTIMEVVKTISGITLGLKPVGNPGAEGIDVEKDIKVVRSEEMPGGAALVLFIPSTAEAVSHAGGGVQSYSAKSAQFKGDKVPLLDKSQAAEVAKLVGELATKIKSGKSVVGEMSNAKKQLIASIQKAASGTADSGERSTMKEMAGFFKAALVFIDKPFVTLNGYALRTGKALLEQVEQSLRAHDTKLTPAANKPAGLPAPAEKKE